MAAFRRQDRHLPKRVLLREELVALHDQALVLHGIVAEADGVAHVAADGDHAVALNLNHDVAVGDAVVVSQEARRPRGTMARGRFERLSVVTSVSFSLGRRSCTMMSPTATSRTPGLKA